MPDSAAPSAPPAAATAPSPSTDPRTVGGEGRGVVVAPVAALEPGHVEQLLFVASAELRRARTLYAQGLPRFADQCCADAVTAIGLARDELARGRRP